MSEISHKVMQKVRKVYLLRQTFSAGFKLITAIIFIVASSTFVSFVDVFRNFKYVFSQGNVLNYVVDAFAKTEGAVIALTLIAFSFVLWMAKDLGKITLGFALKTR